MLTFGNIPLTHQVARFGAGNKQKVVRIVGTGRQGRKPLWVSVEGENSVQSPESGTGASRSCQHTITQDLAELLLEYSVCCAIVLMF